MIIPIEQISREALHGLIEEFITREGTDYGVAEISLDDKVQQVSKQLADGEVLVIFDAATESANLMTKYQYQEWMGRGE